MLKKYFHAGILIIVLLLLSGCGQDYFTEQKNVPASVQEYKNTSSSSEIHKPSVANTAPTTYVSPSNNYDSCGQDYYKNVDGLCVHRPSNNSQGASARCTDGSYSYSQHRQGTCSYHGGVATWL